MRNALDNRDKKYQKLDQTNAPDPKVKRNGPLAGERHRARVRLTLWIVHLRRYRKTYPCSRPT